jgi:hypothetical protein
MRPPLPAATTILPFDSALSCSPDMQEHTSTEAYGPQVNVDVKKSESTVGVLEASPITRATAATGVDTYITSSEAIHPAPAGKAVAQTPSNPATVINMPVTPNVAKRWNIYVVAAFCSLGGFLFGADTGK